MRLRLRIVFWSWFLLAIAAGRFGWLARLPGSAMAGILVGLTALVLAAGFGVPSLRTWLQALDVRSLVLVHISRCVGVYLLFLFHRGELPYALAVPGGWGDIVVAVLALVVVVVPMGAEFRRHACLIWNTFGLVEILLVVATAARIAMDHPWQLRPLQFLPLSILPTFLVPLLIATHVIIFVRLGRPPRETATPA